MSERTEIAEHYGKRSRLGERILAALREAGKDLEHLTPDDLAPVDELHGRGREATADLAKLLDPHPGDRILDVGCGLGGPARFLASAYGCRVTGIDLTDEFAQVAGMLTRRTGLSERVSIAQGDALALPFDDASFDGAWIQNVAMNVADRERLLAEIRRVLRAGGRLALTEITAGPGGAPHFPVPWAARSELSFLIGADALREKLETAGFKVIAWEDVTAIFARASHARARAVGNYPLLGPQLVFGDDFPSMTANVDRSYQEGRIETIYALLERG